MHADVLAGRWAVDFEGKLARSPDDPQRIRVTSVFELFFVCLLVFIIFRFTELVVN